MTDRNASAVPRPYLLSLDFPSIPQFLFPLGRHVEEPLLAGSASQAIKSLQRYQ